MLHQINLSAEPSLQLLVDSIILHLAIKSMRSFLHVMQILAVEVMWTPQDEKDSYTRDELFLDYPTLNTL